MVDDLDASGLLSALRDRKAIEDRAAADQLDLAARWADLHPPESIHSAAVFTVAGCEHEEPIAGEGCPIHPTDHEPAPHPLTERPTGGAQRALPGRSETGHSWRDRRHVRMPRSA